MCPTDILTTKRMVKLNGRDKLEIISIGTINGAIIDGTPAGKKVRKYSNPRRLNPKKVFISKKNNESAPTVVMCEVKVKL